MISELYRVRLFTYSWDQKPLEGGDILLQISESGSGVHSHLRLLDFWNVTRMKRITLHPNQVIRDLRLVLSEHDISFNLVSPG